MHRSETLSATAAGSARPTVELDAFGPAALVQEGDFAAGLRTRRHNAAARGVFATGICEALDPAVRTIGNFASGTRSLAGPRLIGDFATGMRARDRTQPRSEAVARPRPDRNRPQLHWAGT